MASQASLRCDSTILGDKYLTTVWLWNFWLFRKIDPFSPFVSLFFGRDFSFAQTFSSSRPILSLSLPPLSSHLQLLHVSLSKVIPLIIMRRCHQNLRVSCSLFSRRHPDIAHKNSSNFSTENGHFYWSFPVGVQSKCRPFYTTISLHDICLRVFDSLVWVISDALTFV